MRPGASCFARFLYTSVVLFATVVVLSIAYTAAYFVMLKDRSTVSQPFVTSMGRPFGDLRPDYRLDSEILERILEPAHQIDRRVRHEYWNPIPG